MQRLLKDRRFDSHTEPHTGLGVYRLASVFGSGATIGACLWVNGTVTLGLALWALKQGSKAIFKYTPL